ncbi:MAG TPA: hypothetical protein VFQ51_07755, partial [Vicinamibacteria bacterium]|nr:hypothetical protein [Vicinamibacteria bacterium]
MGLTAFTFEREPSELFLELGYDLYRGEAGFVPPLRSDVRAQLSPRFGFHGLASSDHRRFLVRARGRVLARAMATVDGARRDEAGRLVGAVGFFESVDDYAAAADVLGAAVDWLRTAHGIRRVLGPLNFDIWHGYRLMTRGFERDRFFGEPFNKRYYPDFFERFGFSVHRRWNTFELPGSLPEAGLGSATGPSWRDLAARGYRFEPFGARPFDASVALLHEVLTRAFAVFPAFTPIGLPEFGGLMSLARHVIHPECSTFAFDENGAPAGFTTVFVDVADAVRAMKGRSTFAGRLRFLWRRRGARRLLLHLGGITPAESARHSGLARALFHCTVA